MPALTNVIRPAAPARLIASKFISVLQLPPVTLMPSTGSLYFGSFGARTTDMSFQDASNSSATSCAMVLAMCWPMSALATVTTTLPSLPIAYQAVGSKLAGAAAKDSPDVGERRVAQDQAGGGGADDEAAAA